MSKYVEKNNTSQDVILNQQHRQLEDFTIFNPPLNTELVPPREEGVIGTHTKKKKKGVCGE
jgi:hypothetical protein